MLYKLFRSVTIWGLLLAGCLVISCNNNKHDHSAAKEQTMNTENNYSCPMHPEVTGKEGDKCPKCGMKLEPAARPGAGNSIQLKTSPQVIEAGGATQLSFVIKKDGQPVPLEFAHEKKIHLIVVSEDLGWFHHLHPEEQTDGSFSVSETFPAGGKYLLFVDYKPTGDPQTVQKIEIAVKGAAQKTEVLNKKLVAETNGYTVVLENGDDLKTNRDQPLQLSVSKSEKKLSGQDLQQYLGAVAHIVLISKNDKEYLHVHPEAGKGIAIQGETVFTNAGSYRMWVQFQVKGQVFTADFTIVVAEGDKMQGGSMDHGHQH